MTQQPIDGLALLCGYDWAAIRRIERPVSRELMRFHRGGAIEKAERHSESSFEIQEGG
jgi:hypothetical protein